MKDLFQWLITSSADPEKVGLTVKGLLVGIVPALSVLLPILCSVVMFCVDLSLINPAIDAITKIVVAVTTLVSAVMVLWGLVRKARFGRWSAAK